MQTTTKKKVETVGGREYPHKHREQVPVGLPWPFPVLRDEFQKCLPFSRVNETTPEFELVKAFTQSVELINKRFHEWAKVFLDVLQSSVFARVPEQDNAQWQRLWSGEVERLKTLLPRLVYDPPEIITFGLMEEPRPVIFQRLGAWLKDSNENLHEQVVDGFDLLNSRRVVGLYRKSEKKEGVGEYDFFRFHVVHEILAKRESRERYESPRPRTFRDNVWEEWVDLKEKRFRETDQQRTRRCEHHRHTITNGKGHRVGDRDPVKPWFVKGLIDKLTAWLTPHLIVVSGDMVKEEVTELSSSVENWTEREEEDLTVGKFRRSGKLYSPAVTLGHYVLAGWSGADLK